MVESWREHFNFTLLVRWCSKIIRFIWVKVWTQQASSAPSINVLHSVTLCSESKVLKLQFFF